MRCFQCKGEIERPSAFCPHCGQTLSGGGRARNGASATPTSSGKSAFAEAASDLMDAGRQLADNDLARKIGAGAAIGAAAGAVLPVVGWISGALLGGGVVAYKQFKRKN